MAGSKRRIGNAQMGASGVALADILANSVVVLLILILLMVNVKQQQAETQLEQTVDLNVLMARKLANSVVLNALPNSRPAYLHDYNSCEIPHDCNPYLYPIVQIFDEYVSLFHPPLRFTRQQLLAPDNNFDRYMRRLNADQLNNIRVDIYGVGMFYLAIAALREYGAPLNHWHFLGEKAKPPATGAPGSDQSDQLAELLEQGEAGLSSESDNEDSETGGPDPLQQLPEGADLADATQLDQLESESLLPIDGLEQSRGAGDRQATGERESGEPGDQLLEELLSEFARQRGGEEENGQELAENRGRTFRLRIPNFIPPEDGQPVDLNLDPDTLEKVLIGFIFAALNDANNQLRFDPQRLATLFGEIVASPESFNAPVAPGLIRDLQAILSRIPPRNTGQIPLAFGNNDRPNSDPVTLMVRPNSAIETLNLLNAELVPQQRELLDSGSATVDVLLRAYPFVYRGERVQISPDMLVLVLPKTLRQADEQWRPVAIVSPDLEEMTLGFVESGYTGGTLNMPLEVNQIRANGAVLQTDFAVLADRGLWQLSGYYLITLLFTGLLLLLVSRWYLRYRAAVSS